MMLLYLWQLPQSVIGLFFSVVIRCEKRDGLYIFDSDYIASFSLGEFIFINRKNENNGNIIEHEKGHSRQSLYLGWLYIIVIGLPSLFGNIMLRFKRRKWPVMKCRMWYYSLPWESWADRLGGVKRHYF